MSNKFEGDEQQAAQHAAADKDAGTAGTAGQRSVTDHGPYLIPKDVNVDVVWVKDETGQPLLINKSDFDETAHVPIDEHGTAIKPKSKGALADKEVPVHAAADTTHGLAKDAAKDAAKDRAAPSRDTSHAPMSASSTSGAGKKGR